MDGAIGANSLARMRLFTRLITEIVTYPFLEIQPQQWLIQKLPIRLGRDLSIEGLYFDEYV